MKKTLMITVLTLLSTTTFAADVCTVLMSSDPSKAGANCTNKMDEKLASPLMAEGDHWSNKSNEVVHAYLKNGFTLNTVMSNDFKNFVYIFTKH